MLFTKQLILGAILAGTTLSQETCTASKHIDLEFAESQTLWYQVDIAPVFIACGIEWFKDSFAQKLSEKIAAGEIKCENSAGNQVEITSDDGYRGFWDATAADRETYPFLTKGSTEYSGVEVDWSVNQPTAVNPSANNQQRAILYRVESTFPVPVDSVWEIIWGGDFGAGGAFYLDGELVGNPDEDGNGQAWTDSRWWNQNVNHPQILKATVELSAGQYHNFDIYGAEGCCGGPQALFFRVLTADENGEFTVGADAAPKRWTKANIDTELGTLMIRAAQDENDQFYVPEEGKTVVVDLYDESFYLRPCSVAITRESPSAAEDVDTKYDQWQFIQYRARPLVATANMAPDRFITATVAARSTDCGFHGSSDSVTLPAIPVTISAPSLKQCISWGDPHFVSLDNNVFNFYGKGDYFLYQNEDASFVVQSRQRACGLGGRVSCNMAIAVKYLEDVAILNLDTYDEDTARAPKDEDPSDDVSVTSKVSIGGLALERNGNVFLFTTPSGDSVTVKLEYWATPDTYYFSVRGIRVSERDCVGSKGLCLHTGDSPPAADPTYSATATGESLFQSESVSPFTAQGCVKEVVEKFPAFVDTCPLQLNRNVCDGQTCNGNGECNIFTGICQCNAGFFGPDCASAEAITCAGANPCENGGVCVDSGCATCSDSVTCDCAPGWQGATCSQPSPNSNIEQVVEWKFDSEPNFKSNDPPGDPPLPLDGDTLLCKVSDCYLEQCDPVLPDKFFEKIMGICRDEVRELAQQCTAAFNTAEDCNLDFGTPFWAEASALAAANLDAGFQTCRFVLQSDLKECSSGVCGAVTMDMDNDGSGDFPLSGVEVCAADATGEVVACTTTDTDGYCFDLPAGLYDIRAEHPQYESYDGPTYLSDAECDVPLTESECEIAGGMATETGCKNTAQQHVCKNQALVRGPGFSKTVFNAKFRNPCLPDACSENNGGCEHVCNDVGGVAQCSCLFDYELQEDGSSCAPSTFCPCGEGCSVCSGKASSLVIEMIDPPGADEPGLEITFSRKAKGKLVAFGTLWDGKGTYDMGPADGELTLGTAVYIHLDGNAYFLHTSCSVPIGPGMQVGGMFQIVSGESLNGGALCAMDCFCAYSKDDDDDKDDKRDDKDDKRDDNDGGLAPIDCSLEETGCSQLCFNDACVCRPGFELAANMRTCVDTAVCKECTCKVLDLEYKNWLLTKDLVAAHATIQDAKGNGFLRWTSLVREGQTFVLDVDQYVRYGKIDDDSDFSNTCQVYLPAGTYIANNYICGYPETEQLNDPLRGVRKDLYVQSWVEQPVCGEALEAPPVLSGTDVSGSTTIGVGGAALFVGVGFFLYKRKKAETVISDAIEDARLRPQTPSREA